MQHDNASGSRTDLFGLSPATLLALANLATMIAVGGMLWGNQTSHLEELKQRLDELRQQQAALTLREEALEKLFNEDRYSVVAHITGVESDVKYISQTVQELKLLLQPKK